MKRLLRSTVRWFMPPPKMSKTTPWSVAADWALLLTLLLTVSIMVLCSRICTTTPMASGESPVALMPDGSYTLDGGEFDPVVGSVQWKGVARECGWPFPILRQALPITASWTLDDPPETVASRTVPADHPLAAAIDRELSERTLPDWYTTSIRTNGDRMGDSVLLWTNAIFSLGLIWLVLYAIARIPMVFLRAGLMMRRRIVTGVETRRDRSGRCLQCGYNLNGLEMAERCPECGALLW
ncbi:MAG: hypothetical protein VX727_01220 [Planctomycetota bacterium]|nr:hypothetical protein [Planctomycetota bacterium]